MTLPTRDEYMRATENLLNALEDAFDDDAPKLAELDRLRQRIHAGNYWSMSEIGEITGVPMTVVCSMFEAHVLASCGKQIVMMGPLQ
jgi:hypothetical protein